MPTPSQLAPSATIFRTSTTTGRARRRHQIQTKPRGGNDRKKQKMEMLEPEDIAQAIVFVLAQPKRCDIVTLQVRPLKQLI